MNYKAFHELLLAELPFEPTTGQALAIKHFSDYMQEATPYSVFLLKGYAGTGKTALLRAITRATEASGMAVELMATTGRAAKVLANTTQHRASTIHRQIYRATTASIEEGGSYQVSKVGDNARLFIVDEASMIASGKGEPNPFGSGDLLEDLLTYVWSNEDCKLLLVGDTAQLPPIGSKLSDALSPEVLHQCYGLSVWDAVLDEVVRQSETSEVLRQATHLRLLLDEYTEQAPSDTIPLNLSIKPHRELEILDSADLVDCIDSAYRKYGREEVLVITPSNKRALLYNQGIRSRVLDYEEELSRQDRLIVARNNYYYAQQRDRSDFIANGEMLELVRIHRYHDIYGLRFADASIYLPERDKELEVRLLLSSLTDEQAQRSYEQRLDLYNQLALDYSQDSGIADTRRAIRQDAYWGALEVKYGYAVTAHKAQGGQWPCVFIDLGIMKLLPLDQNMLRWLYTALTRSTEKVYLVNAPEEFFSYAKG